MSKPEVSGNETEIEAPGKEQKGKPGETGGGKGNSGEREEAIAVELFLPW